LQLVDELSGHVGELACGAVGCHRRRDALHAARSSSLTSGPGLDMIQELTQPLIGCAALLQRLPWRRNSWQRIIGVAATRVGPADRQLSAPDEQLHAAQGVRAAIVQCLAMREPHSRRRSAAVLFSQMLHARCRRPPQGGRMGRTRRR
jgi:hypothetical protein